MTMRPVLSLDREALMAIPPTHPARLFSGPDAVEVEGRELMKRWHPDVAGGDEDVFKHIGLLLAAAKRQRDLGAWDEPGLKRLLGIDGKRYNIRYVREFDVGLGYGYIGQGIVAYIFRRGGLGTAETKRTIDAFRFPNSVFEAGLRPKLPKIKAMFETADSEVLVIEKPEASYRLRDLIDHCGGKLEPRIMAWVMSQIMDLTCWLQFSNMTHNDISPDSIFVLPDGPSGTRSGHTAHLIGGWWFAVPAGERMRAIQTNRTVQNLSSDVVHSKRASLRTDLGLARLTGREMLGDATGGRMATDTALPRPLVDWLRLASDGDARADYREWEERILPSSFGARRHTRLEITFGDIYGKEH